MIRTTSSQYPVPLGVLFLGLFALFGPALTALQPRSSTAPSPEP